MTSMTTRCWVEFCCVALREGLSRTVLYLHRLTTTYPYSFGYQKGFSEAIMPHIYYFALHLEVLSMNPSDVKDRASAQ